MTAIAVAIFALTYALIASRRLALLPIGRPSGALLGAVLMVATGVLTPEESFAAVDADTLVLLFGMMLLTAYLSQCGLLDRLALGALAACPTPRRLMVLVSLLAAVLSALLVNDTVCLFMTPVVVRVATRAGLPVVPYLVALATSANLGSAATLVGNPQNMIIGSLSGLSFTEFLARAAPPTAAALVVNLGLLHLYYARRLPARMPPAAPPPPAPPTRHARLGALVLTGVAVAFLAGLHLGYVALAGALVMLVADRRDPREAFARVDWPLLVFFAGLFVVVGGLVKTGLVAATWAAAEPFVMPTDAAGLAGLTGLLVAGSNVVSNVPMTLLAGPWLATLDAGATGWVLLGFVTTVAGNLTLLGSVANIIVAEQAAPEAELGYWEYLRFGAVSTVATLAVGVPIVAAMG